MRVALKYCGGCDPAYERVDYFKRIQKTAGNAIQWVSPGAKDYDALLLICGCETVCPLEEMPPDTKIVLIKHDQAAPEEIVARLRDSTEKEVLHEHKDQG